MYATHNVKSGWIVVPDKHKPPSKANLLLSKEWVKVNVPCMTDDIKQVKAVSKKKIKDVEDVEALEELEKQTKKKYNNVPDLLLLDES